MAERLSCMQRVSLVSKAGLVEYLESSMFKNKKMGKVHALRGEVGAHKGAFLPHFGGPNISV